MSFVNCCPNNRKALGNSPLFGRGIDGRKICLRKPPQKATSRTTQRRNGTALRGQAMVALRKPGDNNPDLQVDGYGERQ